MVFSKAIMISQMGRFRTICVFTLLCALPADARALDFFEEHKGWTISTSGDACGMLMTYEGPGATELLLLKSLDESITVDVTNYNWTPTEKKKYKIGFLLNGAEYGNGDFEGYKSQSRRGFYANINKSFESDFRSSSSLWIFLNGEKIDQLSLTGTEVAFQALNRCLRLLRVEKEADAKEKARWESLPEDPFAESVPLKPPTSKPMSDDDRFKSLFQTWAAQSTNEAPPK